MRGLEGEAGSGMELGGGRRREGVELGGGKGGGRVG